MEQIYTALETIMKHAVTGHEPDGTGGFHTYCNEPDHALEILTKYQVFMAVPKKSEEPAYGSEQVATN